MMIAALWNAYIYLSIHSLRANAALPDDLFINKNIFFFVEK